MTIKETVIRESIDRAEKRIEYLKSVIDADPATDIFNARIDGQKMILKYKIQQLAKGSVGKKFKRIAEKERKAKKMLDLRLLKLTDFIGESARITNELMQLKQELYFIELKKKNA